MKITQIPSTTFLSSLAAQVLISRRRKPTITSTVAALVIAGSLGAIGIKSLVEFRKRETTFNAAQSDQAKVLVTDGVNQISRNPMYVGLAGALAGNAIWRRCPAALLPLVAFWVILDRTQIPVEEAALKEKFGEEYARYCEDVPRWLDARSLDRALKLFGNS